MSGVYDLWRRRDGTPSARDGQGLRYRVRVDGYPSTSHRTRVEAEAVLRERLVAGPPRQASTVTVGELLDRWLAGKRGLTRRGYRACVGDAVWVRSRWGELVAAEVETQAVQEWIAALTVQRGPHAARRVEPASEALRRRLVQCLAATLAIGGHTLGRIRVPRDHAREPHFLTAEQLGRVAEACGPYGVLVLLLGTTGLRVGEACALNVGDVDAVRSRLRVRQAKGLRGRDVSIPAAVVELLDLDRAKGEPLLLTVRGRRVDKDVFRARVWNPAVQGLGLDGARIHDLRHTAASLMIASGADVKAVQRQLGHASATLTLDLYGHLFDDRLDAVGVAMGEALSTVGVLRASG